jgi:UDP-N-acetyl-D-mannosaminuronic acid transferase (WecB/TagA/CpsF family)
MELLTGAALVVAITIGITNYLKKAIPERFKYRLALIPVLASAVGGGASIFLLGYSPEVLMQGVLFGLTASGLYEVVKK